MSLHVPAPLSAFDLTMDDGAVIKVRRHGNVQGPRLFISHGNGFAVDAYLCFWRPLLENYELIVFDFRNHGYNALTALKNHNYAQMARDVERIYTDISARLGPKTSIGVFHSMSARAAMKHAVEIGWRWDALLLYDPPNVPPPGHAVYDAMEVFEKRLVKWASNRRDRYADPSELAREYAETRAHSNWVAGTHELMARSVLHREEESRDWVLTCPKEYEASIYSEATTMNLWPRYEEYGGPVKLIGADPDLKGGPPTALANRALHDEYGYIYEAIPGTGHLLQIQKPLECVRAMTSFLAECGIRA